MSSHHHLGLGPPGPSGEIDHIAFLSEHIGALYLNDEYSDVVLNVEGQRFHGHRVILAARSDYFRAMLYGGLRESQQTEIELKDTSLQAFKRLLKYIYTGHMSLANQKVEVVLDILGLAHQYGFVDLEASISDYLREALSVHIVCMVFDAARLYQLQFLTRVCLSYMERHSLEVLHNESFLQLSPGALQDLILRDSFYAPEVDIFRAVAEWVHANPDEDSGPVLEAVRLPLMSLTELLADVRPTALLSPDAILDAIDTLNQAPDTKLQYRGSFQPEENMAHPRLGTQVLQGEMRSALLDGDSHNYDMERGYTRHTINEAGDNGILIKLGVQAILNHMRMLLWDRDFRSYSYYIEVSVNQKDWVRVIDHTRYHCRSWQFLYFPPRVVQYIRIVGTNNTVNKVFHIVTFEAMYTHTPVQLHNGLVVPKENVASEKKSASVIEGVSRSRNALLNGDVKYYDWDLGYTCHQLGSGAILVQLGQPYWLSSMRLLLWDCDKRSYCYYVEVSVDLWDWETVADRTREVCRSWQILRFPPRPVVYIRIVGTHNTANEVFHCVHFECPAQLDEPSLSEESPPVAHNTLPDGGDCPLDPPFRKNISLPSVGTSEAGPAEAPKTEPVEITAVVRHEGRSPPADDEGDQAPAPVQQVAPAEEDAVAVAFVADASRPDVALSAGVADRSDNDAASQKPPGDCV